MKKYIFLFLTIITTHSLFSQTLTLAEAVQTALKNSLDIEVLNNNVEIAKTNNHFSIAGGMPMVTAAINDNQSRTNVNQKLNTGVEIRRNGASANQMNTNITGTILLYNGKRVKTTQKRLAQIEAQSRQQINAQVQNIIAAVATNYYDIIRQQAYIKTIDQSIEVAQRRLDIVKVQQSVGLANNADLFQSQLDLNALLQNKESQYLVVNQAKTDLALLLNVSPDTPINVQDTILVDKSILLEDILKNSGRNAELMVADQQIKIAQLISTETNALRYPTIRANTGYTYNRNQQTAGQLLLNQNSGPFIGLNLAVPIYNGSVFKRQQQIADINTKNASLQKEIIGRNIQNAAVKTHQAYLANLEQLEAQKKNVDLAKQLLDLALQRFQLRQATIVEIRQAQQSFENAGYTFTNLTFAAKVAEIELLRLVNELK